MGKTLILAFLVAFLSIFVLDAAAVTFTASSSPASVGSGQSSQLINFTVENTGGINITQLNITLPPTFTFTGTLGTTSTSPYTASSTIPSWTNSSSIGIVNNTQYFWVYANTPSATGSYQFNISALDASNAFSSNNVTVTLFDITAPIYSGNTTSPSTNTTYAVNQSYWFNVTWTDNVGISKALVEHNITGSGTPHNDTMSNSSSVYYLNATDLAAGTYVWRVYANDTNNTFNSTPQFTYAIRKADNLIDVYINNSLNTNATGILNRAINVTASATCPQQTCNITIARDAGTIASVKPNPYSLIDNITSSGLHNYTISISSNANYSSNSTTLFIGVVPTYSTSSNIPTSFSNSTSTINISFDSSPDPVNALIQGDWSGTAVNYTMSNTSTSSFYYTTSFPAGTNTWRIYGIYSNHTFNLTSFNSVSTDKASPSLSMTISPAWTLESSIQTNVSCTVGISTLTAKLYRNNTLVNNPDVQTFSLGAVYEYMCNNTVNQNYTESAVKNTLKIKSSPLANLTFVEAPAKIEIVQNSSAAYEIKVKNIGNAQQNVTLEVEGLDPEWYSFEKSTQNILGGGTVTFKATFKIGNIDVKEYSAKFNAKGANGTLTQDFTFKVIPSNETKAKANDTIALFKLDIAKLEKNLEEFKNQTADASAAEQKMEELKTAVKQAEDYINSNDYFAAMQKFETIKSLISEVETQLKASPQVGKTAEIPSTVWIIIGAVAAVIIVGGIAAYLFWPNKSTYNPINQDYSYKEAKPNLFKRILAGLKNIFSRLRIKGKNVKKIEE